MAQKNFISEYALYAKKLTETKRAQTKNKEYI